MSIGNYVIRDKYGWPVETTKGKHIANIIRVIIHMSISKTFFRD